MSALPSRADTLSCQNQTFAAISRNDHLPARRRDFYGSETDIPFVGTARPIDLAFGAARSGRVSALMVRNNEQPSRLQLRPRTIRS
jgi:hypothetical protein